LNRSILPTRLAGERDRLTERKKEEEKKNHSLVFSVQEKVSPMADRESRKISEEDYNHQLYSKLTNPLIGGQPSRWDGGNHFTLTMDFSAPPRAPDPKTLIATPYAYSPLPTKTSLRLLKFGADGLSCELITTNLQDAPPYVAFSYTWGAPSFTETLPLGPSGAWHAFPVTKNAYQALNSLGLSIHRQSRTLWIDAICVNQQDKVERAAQVSIMREIYQKATRVYVWLGAPSKGSESAIEKILEWERSLDHQMECYKNSGKLQHGQTKIPLSIDAFADVDSETTWGPIDDLLARDWWARAWIVQEATSNAQTYLFCGRRNIHIDSFYRLYDILPGFSRKAPENADEQLSQQLPYQLGQIRKIRLKEVEVSFLEALQHMRAFKSSDHRDKVYTAFALCPRILEYLNPDYSKGLREVYIDVVRAYIASSNSHQTLDFLGYVVGDHDPGAGSSEVYPKPPEESMPSWVPDWRCRLLFTPLSRQTQKKHRLERTNNAYRASFSTAPSFDIRGEELHIRGFVVDVIDKVSLLIRDANIAAKMAQKDPNPPGFRYVTGQNFREMTLEMIVADLRCDLDGSYTRGYAIDWTLVATDPENLSREEMEERKVMVQSFQSAISVRMAGYTERNYCGLVPDTARVGDKVCVLYGGQVLYVMREREDGRYSFIGECYIHSLMDGMAIHSLHSKTGSSNEQVFVII
jgi:hypothetical protein